MEKLCPVLGLYQVESEDEALQLSCAILRHEGKGHTFALHAQDEAVVERFSRAVPVSRFLVNTPASMGGVGMTFLLAGIAAQISGNVLRRPNVTVYFAVAAACVYFLTVELPKGQQPPEETF